MNTKIFFPGNILKEVSGLTTIGRSGKAGSERSDEFFSPTTVNHSTSMSSVVSSEIY